jgi:Uma2 family endonuclease
MGYDVISWLFRNELYGVALAMPANKSQQENFITEEEYLAGEQQANERHDYVDGQVYAMAGASKQHNRIARNFITNLSVAADHSGCDIYFSDIKVRSESYKSYYYPDIVLSCEDDNENDFYLENPCLIVEITSASTMRKDYLEKALSYQSIDSLKAYLIVSQDKPQVDMLLRSTEGTWNLQQFNSLNDVLELPCLDTKLTLEAVYSGINLS